MAMTVSQAEKWDHGSVYRGTWGKCKCELCKKAVAEQRRWKREDDKRKRAGYIAQEEREGRPVCVRCLQRLHPGTEHICPKDRKRGPNKPKAPK